MANWTEYSEPEADLAPFLDKLPRLAFTSMTLPIIRTQAEQSVKLIQASQQHLLPGGSFQLLEVYLNELTSARRERVPCSRLPSTRWKWWNPCSLYYSYPGWRYVWGLSVIRLVSWRRWGSYYVFSTFLSWTVFPLRLGIWKYSHEWLPTTKIGSRSSSHGCKCRV